MAEERPKLSITQAAEQLRKDTIALQERIIDATREDDDTSIRNTLLQLAWMSVSRVLDEWQVFNKAIEEVNRIDMEAQTCPTKK